MGLTGSVIISIPFALTVERISTRLAWGSKQHLTTQGLEELLPFHA